MKFLFRTPPPYSEKNPAMPRPLSGPPVTNHKQPALSPQPVGLGGGQQSAGMGGQQPQQPGLVHQPNSADDPDKNKEIDMHSGLTIRIIRRGNIFKLAYWFNTIQTSISNKPSHYITDRTTNKTIE